MGMVVIKSNQQLLQEEREREKSLLEITKKDYVLSGLVGHLRKMWEDAKRHKIPIEDRILENERAIRGEYSPEKLRQIRELQGSSEVFMKITEVKCRNFEAWVRDIYEHPKGVPWSIEPTPDPTIPEALEAEILNGFVQEMTSFFIQKMSESPEAVDTDQFIFMLKEKISEMRGKLKKMIKEKAKEKADEMTEIMKDQLYEGGWYSAFYEVIRLAAIKCGILKGPILRKSLVRRLKTNPNGETTVETVEEIIPTYEARHPRFIYPQPGVSDIQKGYLFDRLTYTPAEIQNFIGLPNFYEEEIRAVLRECESGSLREWADRDQEWAEIEGENAGSIHDWENVDCLHFWGPIKGRLLQEFNEKWKEIAPDEDKYYHIEAYLIGNHVIKLVLNPDPNGEKPYSKVSFKEDGTFFGVGLPEIIEDIQAACNACARALVNNVGMASGPQVVVDESTMDDYDSGALVPWKKWNVSKSHFAVGKPIEFYQPNLISHQLIAIFDFFSKMADEHSGVPAYAHGDPQVGGAGNTASGLSMLLTQSARGIKLVIKNIDEKIIEDSLKRQYRWNLERKKFMDLIGDYKIKAKGTMSIIAREQLVFRLNELLSITANEIDMSIIGQDGRKKLLKEILRAHEMDPEEIIPEPIKGLPPSIPIPQGTSEPVVTPPMSPMMAPLPKPTPTLPGGAVPAGGEESRVFESGGGFVAQNQFS